MSHAVRARCLPVAVAVTLSLVAVSLTAGPARGEDRTGAATAAVSAPLPAQRASGPNRIDTAIAASRLGWQRSAEVVLADASNFPDALASGALAASLEAPLLLTTRTALHPNVAAELRRLQATRVHVMGGTAAVSADVEAALLAQGLQVVRVAGPSRFDTAARAARLAGPGTGRPDVVVALGTAADPSRAWPDALSAGAFASTGQRPPLVLTTPDSVPPASMDAIRDLARGGGIVHLLGGTGAVRPAVEQQLTSAGFTVHRIAGANRFATSLESATAALRRLGTEPRPLVLASGGNFPDGLAAASLAARLGGVLLLVPGGGLAATPEVRGWLKANGTRFDRVVAVGGAAAISDAGLQQVRQAAGEPAIDLPAPAGDELDDPDAARTGRSFAIVVNLMAANQRVGQPIDHDQVTALLLGLAGRAGFRVVDSRGQVVVGPMRGVDQGVSISAAEITGWARATHLRSELTLLGLAEELVAAFDMGLTGRELAVMVQQDLARHRADTTSPQRLLATFISELGSYPLHDELGGPYDMTRMDPADVSLTMVQAGFLLLRMGAELGALAMTADGGSARRFASSSGGGRPCQLTDTEQAILDANAVVTTTLFGKVVDYAADKLVTGAKTVGAVVGWASGILQLVQLWATFSSLEHTMLWVGEQRPLERTRSTTTAGERRSLVYRAKVDSGGLQVLNCMRPALNAVGLDISIPQTGELSGAGVRVAGTNILRAIHLVLPIEGRTGTDGSWTFAIEGQKQRTTIPPEATLFDRPQSVRTELQLKPADFVNDMKDALSTAIALPGAVVSVPVELLYRTRWLGNRAWTIPVRDWGFGGCPYSSADSWDYAC
jgi:putative cell wall-binding protein